MGAERSSQCSSKGVSCRRHRLLPGAPRSVPMPRSVQPSSTRLRALLLDAMGTLVRLDPPGPRLRRELAVRFGLMLSPAEAEQAMAAEIAYYRAHMQDGTDAAAVSSLHLAAAEALRAGLPDDRRLPEVSSAELARALVAALHFTPYPDVVPALAW